MRYYVTTVAGGFEVEADLIEFRDERMRMLRDKLLVAVVPENNLISIQEVPGDE